MSKTPKRRRVSVVNSDSPAALKGKKIACPGPVFHESPEKIYAGVIIGTPGNRKNSVTVRFDEDGTRYWFPVEDVKRWIVPDINGPSDTPQQTRTKRKAEAEVDIPVGQEAVQSPEAFTEEYRAQAPANGHLPNGAAPAPPPEQGEEEAQIDALYKAEGWHSFRQFLIFWGFLVMGILVGILIWVLQRPHKK